MRGRAPSAAERKWMDAVARLGCCACRKLGVEQPEVSLHHIDGRTKPGAHMRVIPLCATHHQLGKPEGDWVSVHPWKRSFEARFGTQAELLEECRALVG